MSGGGGGPIIISGLITSGKCTPDEVKTLREIADRNPIRCGVRDSLKVARIVWRILRHP